MPAGTKKVVVVGGGQSGAEVVAHLQDTLGPNAHLDWVTRRSNFLPLDESPFVEDYFTPEASEEFFYQAASVRTRLLGEQQLASDGISDGLLERIYQRMYDVRNGYREGPKIHTRAATELIDLTVDGAKTIRLTWLNQLSGERFETHADFVVLATGYEQVMPSAVEPLLSAISFEDGRPSLGPDFSLLWDGPSSSKIFLQNGARHARGIADPNLSLLAWRSAAIAVSVAPELTERLVDPHLPPSGHRASPRTQALNSSASKSDSGFLASNSTASRIREDK
jgi:lysine N6-hydroxylase